MTDKGQEAEDIGSIVKETESSKANEAPSSPKRIKLGDKNETKKLNRDVLLTRLYEMDAFTSKLEDKLKQCSNNGELTSLRESEEKLKLQQQESTRRENVLVMRLATKEQEMQELLTQIHDLKQSQNPAGSQLRSTLLDPAVNIVFQRMKSELDDTKEKLEQAQNDLSAWKFTPDSVTGKKLMAKCRMLIQENQELGRQLSQGRVAQLEAELALQKKYSEELKASQNELNEFVIQLDEEVEGMQSTILVLQNQLKNVKSELQAEKQNGVEHVQQIRVLEQNLDQARTQPPSPVECAKPTILQVNIPIDNKAGEAMITDDVMETTPIAPEEQVEKRPAAAGTPPVLATHSLGTPPGSTTFSISQILGEPKKVSPISDSPLLLSPGGDAVVTKISHMGGFDDSKGEGLRTGGATVVNGNEDGTQPQPMVT